MDAFLLALGLHLPALVAGALGGLVAALVLNKAGPLEILSRVTVGMFSANYLGPVLGGYFKTISGWEVAADATPFLIGLGGTFICGQFIGRLQQKGGTDAAPRV